MNIDDAKKAMNTRSIEYVASNGTTFKSDRGDLYSGVRVAVPNFVHIDKIGADFAEFGAWHAFWVYPHLNGFVGYDKVKYTFI